jgi:glutamyl-tRNA synthetase
VVAELLARGAAYRDWLSPAQLEQARDLARAEGQNFVSPWRDRNPAEGNLERPHVDPVPAALNGETIVHDLVQGEVRFADKDLDDLVLLRSDGAPTYNLAVVVDDHDMGVTHVIRGDDHLNNAARQQLIYEALGWPVPAFAHIPLIHGPTGAKLSKRMGAGGRRVRGHGLPARGRAQLPGPARLVARRRRDLLRRRPRNGSTSPASTAPRPLDWDKLNFLNATTCATPTTPLVGSCWSSWRARASRRGGRARVARAPPLVKERAKTSSNWPTRSPFALSDARWSSTPRLAATRRASGRAARRLTAALETADVGARPARRRSHASRRRRRRGRASSARLSRRSVGRARPRRAGGDAGGARPRGGAGPAARRPWTGAPEAL